MYTINFSITREHIYNGVFATSAHTARAREAMGIPVDITGRMLLTADDKHVIAPLIDNSVNEVSCDIVRHHPGSSVEFNRNGNDGEYLFNITVPMNYPTGNAGMLATIIGDYILNRTLQSWYTDIKPDEANAAATKAQNDAGTIQALLTQRIKPTDITLKE